MPELPEVETVRRTLEKIIVGKEIKEVVVQLPRIVQKPENPQTFSDKLKGKVISKIERRGKYLAIFCEPWVIVSHLRMEGKYTVQRKEKEIEKHTHVFFRFTDDTELRYKDVRQFGTMDLRRVGEEQNELPLRKLGVEPLSDQFSLQWLRSTIKRRKMNIKAFLLNQEIIAGLGNIYADESLYFARIHPSRNTTKLTEDEINKLYQGIGTILKSALEAGGSSVRSYLNGQGEMGMFQLRIKVYGKKGESCQICRSQIERIVVAGRGTYFCGNCQKA